MADRQTIRGSSAANPEFRGSVRAEDGGQVFVYNGSLDFDETGEFVVSRGPNVVLEVIDASAIGPPGTIPRRQKRSPDTAPPTSSCVLPSRSVSLHCCSAGTSATAAAEWLGTRVGAVERHRTDDRAQAMDRRLEAPIIVATLLMVPVLLLHGGVLFDGPLHRRGGKIEVELRSGGAALSPIIEHPQILFYSRIRKSPFFAASRRHGVAMYSVYNHMYHPRHYGDPVAEYWQLLDGVTLWDVGVERQVEITGPDAFAFTNMLVARDLAKCEVGQCKYVFVTAPDGGIINDPVLLRLGEDHFWLSLADSDVLLWARGVAHGCGLDVTIREPDVGPVQIQGPRSKDVMVELFGDDVLEVPYYFLRRYELDGMPVLVSRTGYTAELGYEIYLFEASRDGERLWDAVLEAGRPHGLAVIGPSHIRRIEGGILAYGADMWLDTNPYEVGMGYDWMVDLEQKDDFIGKEALARIKRGGVRRKLAGVEIAGASLGAYNDGSMIDFLAVSHRGERVGQVTSACHSPRLAKNIGYAMVPVELGELGTELEVAVGGDRRDAVVVTMPFIDPKKEIPKQRLATEH